MTEPQEPKKKKPWWMWVLGIAGLGFVGLCFFCLITMILIVDPPLSDGSSGAAKTEPPPPRPPEPKIEVVSAVDLCNAFHTNEVAANKVLKNEKIRVVGIVSSIAVDAFDNPYVVLEGCDFLSGVQCTFKEKNGNMLTNLRPGQRVIIEGKCGGMMLQSVFLKNCTIPESR